ncbi:hypothetical protein CKF54_07805 [Psittacicella hinzii]|uniref:TonB-dependent siderophore receptor n=1 Tax=Psittacicella hinzii TaxID=2028575 RepID=A0A3A1Y1C8_9GAMM|nr:TonB-dependent siderophore receptor [Psittacicella hinzii]RIY31086.1 hypothetical protein CKF54_07805 [Psittacicella hinzii]
MNKIFKLTTLSVCLATALSSFANESSTNLTLEKITVSGSVSKTGTLKFYSPSSSSTLSTAQANEIGANQLDASLRYTPSVQAQLYGGDVDDSLWFKIRGFDASLFVDGSPVYKNGYTYYSPVLFGYETVEVAKGSNSVLYGTSEAGGAVNLITKRPGFENKGLVQVNVGNREQRGIAFDYNGNYANTLLYRLVASYDHQEGETYGTWGENFYFAPSLTWIIDEASRLTVLTSVQKSTGVPTTNFYPVSGTVDTSSFEINRRTNLGNPDFDFYNRKAYKFGIEYSRELTKNLELNFSYNYLQSEREQLASYYSFMNSGTSYYRGYLYNNTKSRDHHLDLNIANKAEVFNGRNTFVAGLQYGYTKVTGNYGFGTYSGTYDLLNPVSSGRPDYSNLPIFQVNQHQTAFYLQDTFDWNNFIFDLGYRHDRVSSKSDTLGAKESYKTNYDTYSAGVMYNFDFGLSPFVHYSTSFKPLSGSDGVNAYKPITAHQFEYGFKYVPEFIDAKFTVTLFNIKEKNSLVYTSTIAQQIGNNEAKGVELSADFNLTRNLSANLAYTYLDAKTTTTSGSVVRTPLTAYNQASARINYRFDSLPLQLGIGGRYFGESSDQIGNTKDFKVPSYFIVDLMAKYNVNKDWEVLATLTNLTDKKYVTGCYYSCYYGEGRKFNVSLSYKF